MHISDAVSSLNYNRYQCFINNETGDVESSIAASSSQSALAASSFKPTALVFDGPAYRSFDASSFNAQQYEYAQKHVRILSGLYGVLKPWDLIQEYRLEVLAALNTQFDAKYLRFDFASYTTSFTHFNTESQTCSPKMSFVRIATMICRCAALTSVVLESTFLCFISCFSCPLPSAQMGTKLAVDSVKTLYDYWGDTITDNLMADLAAQTGQYETTGKAAAQANPVKASKAKRKNGSAEHGKGEDKGHEEGPTKVDTEVGTESGAKAGAGAGVKVLVNLASLEYFKSVRTKSLSGVRVVECVFKDKGRVTSVYAKRARGLMARYIVTQAVPPPSAGGKAGSSSCLY